MVRSARVPAPAGTRFESRIIGRPRPILGTSRGLGAPRARGPAVVDSLVVRTRTLELSPAGATAVVHSAVAASYLEPGWAGIDAARRASSGPPKLRLQPPRTNV